MPSKKVLILTTAGKGSGFGHIARMIPLREELFRKNIEADFVIHDTGEAPFFPDVVYGLWHSDLEDLKNRTSAYDGVIVDSYFAVEQTFRAIKSPLKIAIDDFERMVYPVDLVIRPSIYRWGKNTRQHAKVYEGPEFIVVNETLRKEFSRNPESSALFISAGGGSNIHALETFCLASKLAKLRDVHVVCGGAYEIFRGKTLSEEFHVYGTLSSSQYAKVASHCGFALTACGTSLSEMAYAGFPAVGVMISEDQYYIGKGFYEIGYLGCSLELESEKIAEKIAEELFLLTNNHELAEKRSQIGRKCVPGMGAIRMAEIIDGFLR